MLEVTEAVSHVIAAVPFPKLSEPVNLFCHPMAQRLQEIAAKGPAASESEIREACGRDLLPDVKVNLTRHHLIDRYTNPHSLTFRLNYYQKWP